MHSQGGASRSQALLRLHLRPSARSGAREWRLRLRLCLCLPSTLCLPLQLLDAAGSPLAAHCAHYAVRGGVYPCEQSAAPPGAALAAAGVYASSSYGDGTLKCVLDSS